MSLFKKKDKISKPEMDVEIVHNTGNVFYVVFTIDGKPIVNGLWRLQYPGNTMVSKLNSSMMRMKDETFQVDMSERSDFFFNRCVFPCDGTVSNSPVDAEMARLYGKNSIKKIDPDSFHPKEYGVWQKLQVSFFDGQLFDTLPETVKDTEELAAEAK